MRGQSRGEFFPCVLVTGVRVDRVDRATGVDQVLTGSLDGLRTLAEGFDELATNEASVDGDASMAASERASR
ncbi:hypothetical protein GFS60_08119 (plasmid) [Rhodococcus sp. WAY2]|nr:hypothetical protein GFS60_08119 [Rhodococcus sp. WAY2]